MRMHQVGSFATEGTTYRDASVATRGQVILLENPVYSDERGLLIETWNEARYVELGIVGPFVQDLVSITVSSGLRGLHLQHPKPQGKLVRVLSGSIYDVVVDVRVGSPTFGRHVCVLLEGFSQSTILLRDMHVSRKIELVSQQLWVPPGFAHGFFVLGGPAVVEYKCTAAHDPSGKVVLNWRDIGIEWPVGSRWAIMSQDDRDAPGLEELLNAGRLPLW
jgi:dTDP-4-dehydrorhamnose 3,5-epimerase